MKRTITPDQTIWTNTANFSGYTLIDRSLGSQGIQEYYDNCNGGTDAYSEESSVTQLCRWCEDVEGFYLSQTDALQAIEDTEDLICTPESFTPREIHLRLMEMAQQS